VNSVLLTGRRTRDPEMGGLASGKNVTTSNELPTSRHGPECCGVDLVPGLRAPYRPPIGGVSSGGWTCRSSTGQVR
jgi:hypothetical protein